MLTFMHSNSKYILAFFLGAITTTGIGACIPSDASSQGQSYEAYQALLEEAPILLDTGQAQVTKAVMSRSVLAFLERDAQASVDELADDYSWNKVGIDGATKMASGREVTYQMTKNLYESDFFDAYLGLESIPLGVIGNLGIQYEVEQFLLQDGSKHVMKTLAIYEMKGGKLWRLWAFPALLGEAPQTN